VVVFAIGGKKFDISRRDVENVLKSLEPEPLKGRTKYYIEYDGRRYPIKQVLAAVTGLPRVSFTAADAYRVLTKLGFEVNEWKK
jgi:hypothetical protein